MRLDLPPLDEDDEIDITPMIDCVFLLVLFFMVTSSFLDEPTMAPVPYTIAAAGPGDKTYTLAVEGTYLLRDGTTEEEIATLAELVERVRAEPGKAFRVETRAVVRSATDEKRDDARVVAVSLPKADRPTVIRRDEADQLTVPRDGPLRFRDRQGERVYPTARDLADALEKRPADLRRPVLLRADAKCEHQRVVQARNALRLGGVELILDEVADGNP